MQLMTSYITFCIVSIHLVSKAAWFYPYRHSDAKLSAREGKSFSAAEDDMADVYPLQLRLLVLHESNSLGIRISKKVSLRIKCLFNFHKCVHYQRFKLVFWSLTFRPLIRFGWRVGFACGQTFLRSSVPWFSLAGVLDLRVVRPFIGLGLCFQRDCKMDF